MLLFKSSHEKDVKLQYAVSVHDGFCWLDCDSAHMHKNVIGITEDQNETGRSNSHGETGAQCKDEAAVCVRCAVLLLWSIPSSSIAAARKEPRINLTVCGMRAFESQGSWLALGVLVLADPSCRC